MRFPNSHFLDHRSATTMHTARCILSFAGISCFISASVALGRHFNAAFKKENNTHGIYMHFFKIHFLIKSSLKTTPSPLTHMIYRIKFFQATISYYQCLFSALLGPLSYEVFQFHLYCDMKYYLFSCKAYLELCHLRWSLFS